MSSYLNTDVEGMTITFRSEDIDLVSHLLQMPLDPLGLREGWITEENPSVHRTGFAVFFRYSRIFANFHDLPFYYRRDWPDYYGKLRALVARHPESHRFEALTTGFEFEWTDLLLFTRSLAGRPTDVLPPVRLPASVDFEDGFYTVVRIVDGTSLHVRPTLHFSAKLDDIPVHLYGPDAPDPGTQQGKESKSVLEGLCRTDAAGKIWIAWERETDDQDYLGYPIKTDGRLVGHAFIQVLDNDYLYVNGLTWLLHDRLDRWDDKVANHYRLDPPTLRGRTCSCELLAGCVTPSDSLRRVAALHPPLCLVRLERVPILDPRHTSGWGQERLTSLATQEKGCPFDGPMQRLQQNVKQALGSHHLSLFDLTLSMLKCWTHSRGLQPDGPVLGNTAAGKKREGKDVFVVHTRSIDLHRSLVGGMTKRLRALGLKVWQYSDWSWTSPDGEVDRATLQELVTTTPAVIVLEVSEEALTSGIREEVKIIDNDFDRLFPLGSLALISEPQAGFFAKTYPLRLGPMLELEAGAQPSDKLLDRVCVFTLRVAIRHDMLHNVLIEGDQNRSWWALDEWAAKAIIMIRDLPSLRREECDVEIPRLTEELLTWFNTLSRNLSSSSTDLRQRTPRFCRWIVEGFGGLVPHDRLSSSGLEALIQALGTIGDDNTGFLEDIRENPTCWEQINSNEFEWSNEAVRSSTRAIARIKGISPFSYVLETVVGCDDLETALELLVEFAETADEKRTAGDFLLKRLAASREDAAVVSACINTIGDLRDRRASQVLNEIAKTDSREDVRLAAVLALIEIDGHEAYAVIKEFLLNATATARIITASAAWRVDLEPIYDLLLTIESDPRMVANVLYSAERAKNPRARKLVRAGLTSNSIYLQQVAATAAGLLLDWLPDRDSYLAEMIPLLRTKLRTNDELLRTMAVISLVRAGQSDLADDAREILARFLVQRKFPVAQSVLVNAALGLADWPDNRTVRSLLYHTEPRIRGTTCFLIARQRRTSFASELGNLQHDTSWVPPYGDGSLTALADTVGENAKRALEQTT